jgi:hypothetical protein
MASKSKPRLCCDCRKRRAYAPKAIRCVICRDARQLELQRHWRRLDPDSLRERNRRWRRANPERVRAMNLRREAREAGILAPWEPPPTRPGYVPLRCDCGAAIPRFTGNRCGDCRAARKAAAEAAMRLCAHCRERERDHLGGRRCCSVCRERLRAQGQRRHLEQQAARMRVARQDPGFAECERAELRERMRRLRATRASQPADAHA